MTAARTRVLVVAPFTHQNGHFVTFPRDVCCGLAAAGVDVTLIHARPFRTELDWLGQDVQRICLKDMVSASPPWWQEVWARLASWPSSQCLAWLIWRVPVVDYHLVLWTDFQSQTNVWPVTILRRLRVYRYRTAFFEHHPPFNEAVKPRQGLLRWVDTERLRLGGLTMILLSQAHRNVWHARLGTGSRLEYLPYGVWPSALNEANRAAARVALGIPADARVLLVFGVQAVKRKHLDTLHAALSSLAPSRPLVVLFTGSRVGDETHPFAEWQRTHVDVRLDDRFVSDAETVLSFAAADAAWTHYRDFPGASGVLLQCMGFGRIAIAAGDGEIGEMCREHGLGLVVAEPTPASIANTLTKLVEMPATQQIAWETDIAATAQRYAWPGLMRQLLAQLDAAQQDGTGV
jgi:glycosyltransferase involved in cell wall biosynthesis